MFISQVGHVTSCLLHLIAQWELPSLTFTFSLVDKRSMIVDAGKMHVLDELLTKLKREGHRVLIYSTMTKVIDLLEVKTEKLQCYCDAYVHV